MPQPWYGESAEHLVPVHKFDRVLGFSARTDVANRNFLTKDGVTKNTVYKLGCLSCGWEKKMDSAGRLKFLQRKGHARKIRDPHNALLPELFRALVDDLKCEECKSGRVTLSETVINIAPEEDDDELWGGPRRCKQCNAVIGKERLEALPEATICIACATASVCASKCDDATNEYCPSCGAQMIFAVSSNRGNTYSMRCTSCRYQA